MQNAKTKNQSVVSAEKRPRVALVHDYLNQFGGAERVLIALAELFPEAPIYTLFYDPAIFGNTFGAREIKTSFLDHAFVRKNHRFFIPVMHKAAESLDLGDEYDLIISSSSSFCKGVTYKSGTHVSYVHALLRYAWDSEKHLKTYFPAPIVKLLSPVAHYLKEWDRKTGSRPDVILTNSRHTQHKIREGYGREAEIIHPPVDDSKFYLDETIKKGDYFLSWGRIISYKRLDLTIQAFNKLKLPLIIVGTGAEEKEVGKLITSPHIKMMKNVSDNDLRKLINGARATILPQEEEFGLVAAESVACGTPIIAYNRAGFREILQDEVNGIGFDEQSENALTEAIDRFQKSEFDRKTVASTAEKFRKENFQKRILEIVDSLPF